MTVDPTLVLAFAGLLGLVVGSFLNVVISRLPQMLETEWRTNAVDILGLPAPSKTSRFNLVAPSSNCPKCHAQIQPLQNIPVVSFILQRGRCVVCKAQISLHYPLVEIAAAIVAMVCAWRFGPTIACAFALVLSWALLALAVIDWRAQLLPDNITLPLLWLGLLAATMNTYVTPISAIIGAISGYLVLWLIFHVFKLLTGKHGMGHGDFKLLAVLGAWLGWQQLPVILLVASATGAITGIFLISSGKLQRSSPMPFGPFLAAAGWLSLIAGDTMLQNYLMLAGLN